MRRWLIAAVAFAAAGPAWAELPVRHALPEAAAIVIAQGTLESCLAKGYAVSGDSFALGGVTFRLAA